MRDWSTETENTEFHIPVIANRNRNLMVKNSQEHSSPCGLALPLTTPDLPESEFFFGKQGGEQPAHRITMHKWYYTGKCT